MGLELDDMVKIKMMNGESHEHKGWGLTTAVYLVVAAIILAFFVYVWQKNCNEKVQFATSMARMDGRLDAIEPAVTAQGKNLFKLNGTVSATVQGAKDMDDQLYELNQEVIYGRRGRRSCGCDSGCGGREFRQSQTYNLASTTVTVDDTCRS